LAPWPGS